MRRHSKASAVGSILGAGSGRARLGGAFAIRGVVSGSDGRRAAFCAQSSKLLLVAVAIASAFLLCFATPSHASLGVDQFWGNTKDVSGQESIGGRFNNKGPYGIAVYEATGDVYVADSGFNRVQQFDEDGNFVRAWGFDVNSPASNPGDETFEICTTKAQCQPGVSGNGLGGALSNPAGIAVNQTNGHVYVGELATFHRVQEFTSAGAFVRAFGQDVVSSGPGDSGAGYEICVAANGDVCKPGASTESTGGVLDSSAPGNTAGQLTVAPASAPNAGNVLVTNSRKNRVQEFTPTGAFVRAFGWDVVQPGGSGASNLNEQQKITLSPGLAGGTFTLSYDPDGPFDPTPSQATPALPASAEASAVEAALAALSNIGGAANVDVSGPTGGPWTVEFTGALGDRDVEALTVATASVALGTQLSCSSTASNSTSTSNQWLRNGVPITGATGATYTTNAASTTTPPTTVGDAGASVQCLVTKSNANAGSIQVSANPVPPVIATPSGNLPFPPFNLAAPAQSGALAGTETRQLTCNAGAWQNSPTSYTYQWYRNGVPFGSPTTTAATNSKVTLLASEQTPRAVFQCLVTATNANGATSKASQNRATSPPPENPSPPAGNTGSPTVTVPLPSGTVATTQAGSLAFEVCVVSLECQAGKGGTGTGQFAEGEVNRITEDRNGNIYTVEAPEGGFPEGLRVQKFTLPANVVTPQGGFDCAELCGTKSGAEDRDNPTSIAVDGLGFVYLAKAFVGDEGDPSVTRPTALSPIWQERVLKVDPAGNGGNGKVVEVILANPGIEPGVEGDPSPDLMIQGISGIATTATDSRLYFATAFEPLGTPGRSRIYRLGEIEGPSGSVSTAAVGATAVTLNATIVPADTLVPVKTLYHFEYRREGTTSWVQSPSDDINIGNGSAGGESSSCAPELEAAICHVTGEIDGLQLGRTYEYRLVARTSYRGALFTSAPQEFTTTAVSPSVVTGGAVWGGPPETEPSLTLSGRINPQGGNTTYAFEYVTQADYEASGFADAQTAPVAPISAGHGAKTLDVVAVKNGLDAFSAYRFRLVATNPAGSTTGNEGVVAAAHAGDRFIELVSNGDSQGGDVNRTLAISDDGLRAAFTAISFGDDQQAAHWIVTPAIAERGKVGWATTPMAGDPLGDLSGLALVGGTGDAAVTQRLWATSPAPQSGQWAVRKLDGTLAPISPVISPLDRTGSLAFAFQGGAHDLSSLVFTSSGATFFPGEPLLSGGPSNLYKLSGAGTASPSLSLLNRAEGGGVLGGVCGARLGSGVEDTKAGAVSADGSTVYFSARTAEGESCSTPVRIYKRVGDAPVVEISACGRTLPATCTSGGSDSYWGASADGSKVFFTTSRQLTDSDADSAEDLYLYDSSPPAGQPNLVQVSAGELVPGQNPGDPAAHEVGAGAEVRGLVDLAMDGSRVYFVAKGRLTPEGTTGANNLYVFQRDASHPSGGVDFVAELTPGDPQVGDQGDPRLWINGGNTVGGGKPAYALPRYEESGGNRVDGDGRLLVFVSRQSLVPADQDTANDVYRYDDEAGEFACMSCAGDTGEPATIIGRELAVANPDQIQRELVASADGSKVVFRTKDRLLPSEDTNSVDDVYLWDEGTLSLVSGATAGVGVAYGEEGGGPSLSADGKAVFFLTRATLLPQDLDNGARDYYAARVDGGFPQSEAETPCVTEAACRTAELPRPPEARSPGSAGFTGSGDVKPKKCSKKRVLRGGRCVKPKSKKHKHKSDQGKSGKGKKQSRDGSGRRAGR